MFSSLVTYTYHLLLMKNSDRRAGREAHSLVIRHRKPKTPKLLPKTGITTPGGFFRSVECNSSQKEQKFTLIVNYKKISNNRLWMATHCGLTHRGFIVSHALSQPSQLTLHTSITTFYCVVQLKSIWFNLNLTQGRLFLKKLFIYIL